MLCANDPSHGEAVAGIGGSDGRVVWLCLDCFADNLRAVRDRLEEAIHAVTGSDRV